MAESPEALVQSFRTARAIRSSVWINEARPELWTQVDLANLTAAARGSRCEVLGVSLNLQWSRRSIQPVLALLESSSDLASLNLGVSPDNRSDANRALCDLMFEAVLRNPQSAIDEVNLSIYGNPTAFEKFLSSLQLKRLVLHGDFMNSRRSSALARALGPSLEEAELTLEDSHQTTRILHGFSKLPSLRSLKLVTNFDRACLLPALSKVMDRCPMQDILLRNSNQDQSDIDVSDWLANTRFAPEMWFLYLDLLLITERPPRGSDCESVRLLSLRRCNIGEGFFHILPRFKSLQTLKLEDCRALDAIGDDYFAVLLSIQSLSKLKLENFATLENLPAILAYSPHTLELTLEIFGSETVESLAKGLKAARNLRVFKIKMDALDAGALLALGKVLARNEGLEGITLAKCERAPFEINREEVKLFLRELRTAQIEMLDFQLLPFDQELMECLFELAHSNSFITGIEPVQCKHGSYTMFCVKGCREFFRALQFQLKLNRHGHRLIGKPSVPTGLWADVLAEMTRQGELDVLFVFVKALVGALFAAGPGQGDCSQTGDRTNDWTTVARRQRRKNKR